MTLSTACKNCPFRSIGGLPYSEEGHENLEEGHIPSCHLHTEIGKQFDDPFPSDSKSCKGYAFFMEGADGFSLPKRTSVAA